MATLMRASHQWSSRPDDQRFVNLNDLYDVVASSRQNSREKIVSSRRLEFRPTEADPRWGLEVVGQNGTPATPTHWSFGQLAQLSGAPAGYLRSLPAPIAADALNFGLKFNREIEDVGVLLTRSGDEIEMRAATGPRYGRIWNEDIVKALLDRFGDGVTGDWRVPGEFGKAVQVTKDNTTIYGSDRDIFVFLADETHRINVPDRRNGHSGSMARGFFVWNSEVGSQSIGMATFLFDYVCCNRIVWGAEQVKEVRIRHTVSAPDRWLEEVTPILVEYANSSAKPVEDTIKAAQARKIDKLDEFLGKRFSAREVSAFKTAHEAEEGRPIETLWDVVTGATAYAKNIKHQDNRVDLERKAGKLLDLVAA